jgi:PatG Domain
LRRLRKASGCAQPLDAFHAIEAELSNPILQKVMEQPKSNEPLEAVSASASDAPVPVASPARPAPSSAAPLPCPTCGVSTQVNPPNNDMTTSAYIYALGRIEPRFPRLSLEKEYAQATGRAETAGLTDRQALQTVLSERQNRYLARQLCWVLTIEGLDTYILQPGDPTDLQILIESLRPTPQPGDVDVVVGRRGPIAPPELCNGLMVPIVIFDQIYSFDRESFIKSIPRPEKISEADFGPAAQELFDRIIQMADNAGSTDADRAVNYLALRYPAIYGRAAESFAENSSLTGVEARPSPLSGTRKIVEVIFSYTNRETDVTEKFFVRVDVTEEFPFLVTKMSPYYDR